MTEEEALRSHLLADGPVVALVGTRIYQLKLPQNAVLPAVRVQLVSVLDFFHLRGGSLTKRTRIQTDAVAAEASGTDPYATVIAVADAVHLALNGRRFALGTPVELEITGVMRVNRLPMYEAAELRQVRMVQDYIVWSRSQVN